MAPLSKKTVSVQHFTHVHPLTEAYSDTEFLCDGCKTLGTGTRYKCEPCGFDLHDYCATCPTELSSFMHEHNLKLVTRKPKETCQIIRVCDLCNDPVEGLFYRCQLCEFDVHPCCTQLPEFVRHVMHKEHPLKLQRMVPAGMCMVCKDTCTSWHYRCGICNFGLHLECVLQPVCEEAAAASTPMSTSRSIQNPVPAPSAPPFFDANYNHVYGYGGFPIPPPSPYFGYGVPPPMAYFSPYGAPPPIYGIPASWGEPNINGHQHNSSHGQGQGQGGSGKPRKKFYKIAGKLALGVGSVVFGLI